MYIFVFGDDGDRIESWSREKFKDKIFYVGQGLPDRCFMHFQPSGMKTESLACPLDIKKAFSNKMAIVMATTTIWLVSYKKLKQETKGYGLCGENGS